MLRCGPLTRSAPRVGPTEVDPPPSDPLVRGLPSGKDTDQGFGVGARGPGQMGGWGVRGGPRVFDLCDGAGSLDGGGDEETRTPDPLLAKEMLYQLSYVPSPRLVER